MIARLQKSMKEKDEGFTLIELLVVIVIIGILAAIAIPIFLNQRKKGVDASLKSDLKSAATTIETYYTDPATDPTTIGTETVNPATTAASGVLKGFTTSPGNTVTLKPSAAGGGNYCIFAYNSGASDATSSSKQLAYISNGGGLTSTVGAATCS